MFRLLGLWFLGALFVAATAFGVGPVRDREDPDLTGLVKDAKAASSALDADALIAGARRSRT
ncbi:MAG: hypothetical protein AAF726_22085 [Planctomycetota bacterium]